MNPIQILVNGAPIQIGASIPKQVTSLEITNLNFPVPINHTQAILIKQWLNTLIDNLDLKYITYNGTLIESSSISKFSI